MFSLLFLCHQVLTAADLDLPGDNSSADLEILNPEEEESVLSMLSAVPVHDGIEAARPPSPTSSAGSGILNLRLRNRSRSDSGESLFVILGIVCNSFKFLLSAK